MNKERYLVEVGLADQRWKEDACWAVYGNWDLTEFAEEEAVRLRRQVLDGSMALNDLRGGVSWANALDKEAVEIYGADLSQGEQRSERTARRLMHLAGRSALKTLRNKNTRNIEIARTYLETDDINDKNLVQ